MQSYHKTNAAYAQPRGPQAVRLRQRKFQLLVRFRVPADLLPSSLSRGRLRCIEARPRSLKAVREVLTINAQLLVLARRRRRPLA